ncbi:MAG: helix-turn-helix domain-containing protein [Clostridia bacterium]|nr:helix-turn-helix domain-containing protein [Clostridia bacterium]MBQ9480742.1 helix-turn-helix domain-containing protein [Clostridia bacterium]
MPKPCTNKRKYETSSDAETFVNSGNLQLIECGYAEVNDEWHKFVAVFPYYRLYLVTGGKAVMYLKDSSIDLEEGYLYLIPSFQVVTSKCADILKHYYLHFSSKNNISSFMEFFKPVQKMPATETDRQLFDELLDCFSKEDVSSVLKKEGIFRYLLAKFYENAEYYNVEMMRFESVLNYIDGHIGEHIDAAALASAANLSEVYFSNLFSKTFGISPIKYVNYKKMNIAATMLAENKMSVKEIAWSLGYENEMYFFRLFKKTFGIPPGTYKKQLASTVSGGNAR